MDATKRLLLPILTALMFGAAFVAATQVERASAQVAYPTVPPTLRAAIQADVEARGHKYGGDCKFDGMYLSPGVWCSFVQAVAADGAVVSYGRFASDETITAKFVRQGAYGWVNPETGNGSPERVPALAAQPGSKPASWVIEGINFLANQDVTLFDGSGCGGEQRCPGDHQLGIVKAGADGYFKITIQFDPSAKPVPGQVHRLIQASNSSFLQVAFDQSGAEPTPTPIDPAPQQPVPTQPVPGEPSPVQPAPAPATAGDSDDNSSLIFGLVAVLGLATVGTVGVVTFVRR